MSTLDDYDTWSKCILQNLIASGNEGPHTADYIFRNHVNIVIVDNDAKNLWWKVKISLRGLQLQNTLFVSRYIANMPPDDPWVLMEFVHETRHLEQGLLYRLFGLRGDGSVAIGISILQVPAELPAFERPDRGVVETAP